MPALKTPLVKLPFRFDGFSMARRDDPERLFQLAKEGDRQSLARLLSLVERSIDDAAAVSKVIFPHCGGAQSIGITGAPGAGKSTLTSALIAQMRNMQKTVSVVAIDPSSPFTGGALLGDRVRMGEHALDDDVFIRSMATRGQLGGLSIAVPDAVNVFDAVGFDFVVVETVGVGQVEVEVATQTDTVVVVVNPGWGDAVQANKAGLMEIADIFVVNKADRKGASETVGEIERMLSMRAKQQWRPPIISTVATTGENVEQVFAAINQHRDYLENSGEGKQRRAQRRSDDLRRMVATLLAQKADLLSQGETFKDMAARVQNGQVDPWSAAQQLLD